ncbi:HNH endonuclease [Paenibacillus chitinolyticus]|uniref:HNH endonuclease n=1 Tax=Paenibacillus chitinolyticus TaxID=79263 RepID=UPI001C4451A0|nr:HNH endonuclease signature motif containing protein [Paenibacillus chitinolyticus]MBV6714866.1 HNH endonuclease [Paenibacillus chitinolyticus]
MKTAKHIKFSYSQAIQLASGAIEIFYNEEDVYGFVFEEFWEELKSEFILRLAKPNKRTILHYYLDYVDGFVDNEIRTALQNLGSGQYESYISYVIKLIEEAGYNIKQENIDYELIEDCGHCSECEECRRFDEFVNYLINKKDQTIPTVINSAFHLLMLNKSFLRDFHEAIAEQLKLENYQLSVEYPEFFNRDNSVKRQRWPVWLKRGLFYRDNGVCVLCRKDLTGVINRGNGFEIDHIVPISFYGSNDPSNLQILCRDCNLKKSNSSSLISVYAVPLWDPE